MRHHIIAAVLAAASPALAAKCNIDNATSFSLDSLTDGQPDGGPPPPDAATPTESPAAAGGLPTKNEQLGPLHLLVRRVNLAGGAEKSKRDPEGGAARQANQDVEIDCIGEEVCVAVEAVPFCISPTTGLWHAAGGVTGNALDGDVPPGSVSDADGDGDSEGDIEGDNDDDYSGDAGSEDSDDSASADDSLDDSSDDGEDEDSLDDDSLDDDEGDSLDNNEDDVATPSAVGSNPSDATNLQRDIFVALVVTAFITLFC